MATTHARPNRNREIRQRHAAGESMTELAREYGISRQRVDQIIKPDQMRAREAVAYALRTGKMERPDECERCGSPDPHGHHPDYSEPLEVEWLCVQCHAEEHAGERVDRVERKCPVCGTVDLVLPSTAARTAHCSINCAAITRGLGMRYDRTERVEEVAGFLSEYVESTGYIPGVIEFAVHVTGVAPGSATATLCGYVDTGQTHFGSYAATVNAVYAAAGYERPSYGRLPVGLIGTVGMTEAAEILNIGRNLVDYHAKRNGLPSVEGEGHPRRFWPHDIVAWKEDRERGAA